MWWSDVAASRTPLRGLLGCAVLLMVGACAHADPPGAAKKISAADAGHADELQVPVLPGVTGMLRTHAGFASRHVAERTIQVWLPPGYDLKTRTRYPVLYMHDGQNLFDPALSYSGVDWGVDETMTRLLAEGTVREAIVVGIWNTPRRFAEYMPRKALAGPMVSTGVPGFPALSADELLSDAYLRFLVEELKPFIDRTYRTSPGPKDTAVMGSSMGGLVSLYAATEYPRVFGAAGAVSTHWPAANGAMIDYLDATLSAKGAQRFYFDHGTRTLDARYAPFQQRMDAVMRRKGFAGTQWVSRRFEGAEHSEVAWRARLHVPLQFLLGAGPQQP